MSFAATDAAWAYTQLPPTVKLVLLAVARRANADEVCWPSQKRLAADTGLSERSVRKALSELEQGSLIGRTQRVGPRGRTSDLITLSPLLLANGRPDMSGRMASTRRGEDRTLPRAPRKQVVAAAGDSAKVPAGGAATIRHVVPDPPGSICRGILSEEQIRENPGLARAGDLIDMEGDDAVESGAVSRTVLFAAGDMPMPGDPLPAAKDRIANLMIEIGAEIGPAFVVDADGIRDTRPLAQFMLRHPYADHREALISLARFWIQKGREPIRTWSLVVTILERRLERYPQLRDRTRPQ